VKEWPPGGFSAAAGGPHLEVVLRLEELEQGPLQLAIAEVSRGVNLLAGERVDARVVHARGDVSGRPHKEQDIRRSHHEEDG
jgi:hypothetical protein